MIFKFYIRKYLVLAHDLTKEVMTKSLFCRLLDRYHEVLMLDA